MIDFAAKLSCLRAERDHAARRADEERLALQKAERDAADALEAQRLIQAVAERVQAAAHAQIARVASRCLEAVFGDDAYEFKIRFSQKRGKTEAEPLFVRDGRELGPGAVGGGVIDVCAFALRVAALKMTRPLRRQFLSLDEPFRFVSVEYRPAIRDLVLSLAKETGIQFLIVTHSQEFRMGRVVDLS